MADSWRADAVEPARIIRPLGIAEIGPATGEGVGMHRRPGVIGQVRAGLYDDGDVRCPRDVEAKPVGFDAEVRTGG